MKRARFEEPSESDHGVPVELFERVLWTPTVLAIMSRIWDVRDMCALAAVNRRMYWEWTREPSERVKALALEDRWGGGSFKSIRKRALRARQKRWNASNFGPEFWCFWCERLVSTKILVNRTVCPYATCTGCLREHIGNSWYPGLCEHEFRGFVTRNAATKWAQSLAGGTGILTPHITVALWQSPKHRFLERKHKGDERYDREWELLDVSEVRRRFFPYAPPPPFPAKK